MNSLLSQHRPGGFPVFSESLPMNRFNLQSVRNAATIASGALLSGIASAQATADAAFTAAVADSTAQIQLMGAALVGMAAVGVVFMIVIKYVKKIRGAA